MRTPFNIGINNARPSSLTITWDSNNTNTAGIIIQERVLGTEQWTNNTVLYNSVDSYDVAPLRGHTYYEIRLVFVSTGESSLVAQFHTCEPARSGPNCEYCKYYVGLSIAEMNMPEVQ